MSDIVQRLKGWCPHEDECPRVLIDEAADEIERLRAELAAANRRIDELEAPIRNPLSSALELKQALAAMRKGVARE